MNGVNKVILVGTVGKDPEFKATTNSSVASFPMVTSETYKGEKKSEWHNVVAWGKLPEIIDKYVKKGSKLYVEGKITTRSWDDKEGNKKYKTEINIFSMQMLGEKKPKLDPEEPRNQEPVTNSDLPF